MWYNILILNDFEVRKILPIMFVSIIWIWLIALEITYDINRSGVLERRKLDRYYLHLSGQLNWFVFLDQLEVYFSSVVFRMRSVFAI